MIELKEYKGLQLASAKELHKKLGIKKYFSDWVKYNVNKTLIEYKKDFYTTLCKSTGGRPVTNYLLTRDAALGFVMVSGGQFAKIVRDEVLKAFQEKTKGLSFTIDQIHSLIDLSKSMTLISIQKEVEKRHFAIYNDKYTWYDYQANLLGYSTKSVIEAMRKVNKKHKSIRKSLVKLDANELIRTGVIDFFIALGKDEIYAKNAGNLCKKFASEMKLGNQIWDDIKENPLKLNETTIIKRKQIFKEIKNDSKK